MLKDNHLILIAEKAVYGGKCIAREDGKVVFISDILPNEKAFVCVSQQKNDFLVAHPIHFYETSAHRIEPQCSYFKICGGCHLQFASAEYQALMKQNILQEAIYRQTGIDLQIADKIISPSAFHYKYRARFKIINGKIGFYRQDSNDLVPIDKCLLTTPGINTTLSHLINHVRWIKQAECWITGNNDTVIYLKIKDVSKSLKEIVNQLKGQNIVGIVAHAENTTISSGKTQLNLPLLNYQYNVSSNSFFQTNWQVNNKLITYLLNILQVPKDSILLDLYAGGGNFAIPLSDRFSHISAVESCISSYDDLRRNIVINNIKNIDTYHCDVENFSPKMYHDIVIVDPPRAGLTNKALNLLSKMSPQKIIYISCNPSTLARDIKKLMIQYNISSLLYIDFFPQTYHIESLVLMELK